MRHPRDLGQAGVGDRGGIGPDPEVVEVPQAFQVDQAGVGDLGVEEHQVLEPAQAPDVDEPGVGQRGPREVEMPEVLHPRQVGQAGPRHPGLHQAEVVEVGQPRDVGQAGVGDPVGAEQGEPPEFLQALQMGQAGVGDRGAVHVQDLDRVERLQTGQVFIADGSAAVPHSGPIHDREIVVPQALPQPLRDREGVCRGPARDEGLVVVEHVATRALDRLDGPPSGPRAVGLPADQEGHDHDGQEHASDARRESMPAPRGRLDGRSRHDRGLPEARHARESADRTPGLR